MNNFRTHGKRPFHIAVIHGGPGAPGSAASLAKELSSHFGVLEPFQTATSIDGQIVELKAVLEARAHIPITLIGHSWGAWLSYLFSARYPSLVKKLILVGSGPYEQQYVSQIMETRFSRLTDEEKQQARDLQNALDDPDVENKGTILCRFGELMSQADSFAPLPEDIADLPPINDEIQALRPDMFKKVMEEAMNLRKRGELLRRGKEIRCPVVAIHGEYDSHPFEGVKKPLSGILEDFRFILLPDCGHKPWVEQYAKDTFYKILMKELKNPNFSEVQL